MKRDEVEDTLDVIEGTLSIHSYLVTVLFDSGVSHLFVAFSNVEKLMLFLS